MHSSRRGFTLIELLVVVTVISILALIALQVAGAAISEARAKSTESTLWRLQKIVDRKAQALQRLEARSPAIIQGGYEWNLIERTPSLAALPLQVKRLVTKKLMLAHHFPQAQSEMWDSRLYPLGTTLEQALLSTPLGDWAPGPDDDLRMVDAWGHAILFLRWPAELFKAHPELLPGAAFTRDPDDPLCQLSGLFASPGAPFDPLMPVAQPQTCMPYVMLFVSAGPDGRHGCSLPLGAVISEEDLQDDIFSLRVR
jgi:prepilin-type N-terminal cleavage/methylation domain-containing protein